MLVNNFVNVWTTGPSLVFSGSVGKADYSVSLINFLISMLLTFKAPFRIVAGEIFKYLFYFSVKISQADESHEISCLIFSKNKIKEIRSSTPVLMDAFIMA